jgi:acetyltransferase-like isoleucine patch superfamily enzyme
MFLFKNTSMQEVLYILFKVPKRIIFSLKYTFGTILTKMLLYLNKIEVGRSLKSTGVPFVSCTKGGKGSIGNNFKMHNILSGNPIGRAQRCIIVIGPKGNLNIGNNVGMSFCAINCKQNIQIKDNVVIGGGTCIYDSDFHPLDVNERNAKNNDTIMAADVVIEDNVFIGTNSTILKGVTIGMNSIVGACSVVTKSIPPGEIWGGNPAKFIRKI